MDGNRIASAPASSWDYDMDGCPTGRKVLLLTTLGVAVIGAYPGGAGYAAWAPLPDRDKAKEAALGVRIGA